MPTSHRRSPPADHGEGDDATSDGPQRSRLRPAGGHRAPKSCTAARANRVKPASLAALWVLAIGFSLGLGYIRWRSAWPATIKGGDFGDYLAAAQAIDSGRSPYAVGQYVYPPPLALVLAPFAHASFMVLWKAWTAIMVGAMFTGIAAFLLTVWNRLASWVRPVAFAICAFTMFALYYPVRRELVYGQADVFVFALVALSALAAVRSRVAARGALIGAAGLVTVWPWALLLVFFQRGSLRRFRGLTAALLVALLAPLTAAAFGAAGLHGFLKNDITQGGQHSVSDSVWVIPELLFSHSGLAQPLVASAGLRVALTGMLAAWVLGLLVIAMRTAGDPALGTWNVLFCILLLMPLSHRFYVLCVLPLLWWWLAALTSQKPVTRIAGVVSPVLVLWWVTLTFNWPNNGDSPALSAVLYCVPFVADLVACTFSVIAAWDLSRSQELGQPASLFVGLSHWRGILRAHPSTAVSQHAE